MKNLRKIAILLASYNGEKYIVEQIESIRNQTSEDWTLYIHDDGSTDTTISLIEQFQALDDRIVLLKDDPKHLGPGFGFMYLLQNIESELYMFCDQDDVWVNDKIHLSLKCYSEINNADAVPVVVHSDVTVVDENLNLLAESYWHDLNLNPDKINTYSYFGVCVFTNGNTMLFNNIAKNLCYPLSEGPIMHDRYVSGRVLKFKGIVHAIHRPLVLYRQHGKNVCGFQVGNSNSPLNRIKKIKEVIINNYNKYQILKYEKYGSIFKYLWYKLLVEIHFRLRKNY